MTRGGGKMPEVVHHSYHHSRPHTELDPEREESRKRERSKSVLTSIILSCCWAWTSVTSGKSLNQTVNIVLNCYWSCVRVDFKGLACGSFANRDVMKRLSDTELVCGYIGSYRVQGLVTLRTRSWSSIMPRSLPVAWAILFPATRFPTITDAGPTPTTRQTECETNRKTQEDSRNRVKDAERQRALYSKESSHLNSYWVFWWDFFF